MDEFMAWLIDNKEWLFSGVGAVLVAWVGRFVYRKRRTAPSQVIRAGNNSTNLQAGRDIGFNAKKKGDDAQEG